MNVKNSIILPFLFALLGNVFFYRSFGVLGISLFLLLFFLFELLLYRKTFFHKQFRASFGILTVFFILFLFNAIRTDNTFIIVMQVGSAIGILGLLYYVGLKQTGLFGSMAECVLAPLSVLGAYIGGFVGFLGAFFSKTGEIRKTNHPSVSVVGTWIRPLVTGLLIGLPVVLVLFGLLVHADPIFKHAVETLKFPSIPQELSGRLWLTGLLFLCTVPFAYASIAGVFFHPLTRFGKFHIVREFIVVIAMVSILLGAFCIIQWPYIFARVAFETDLSKFGVATYSEYVRKGFGELLFVVFIVYGVLWIARIAKGLTATRNERIAMRIASGILLALTAVFILSIGRRVYLYQSYHGWSLIRIYGVWLLTWISMMLATLELREYKKLSFAWANIELCFTLVWVLFLGFFNAESFIVHSHPPTVNKRIDYIYLSRLSADGYDGWKEAYGFARKTLIDKNLLQQPLIQIEDRRDVAYSIAIVSKLTQHYQKLLQKYGTEEEKKGFVIVFLTAHRDEFIRHKQFLEMVIPKDKETYEENTKEKMSYEQTIQDIDESLQRIRNTQWTFEQGMWELLPNFSFWNVHAGDRFFTNSDQYAQRNRLYWFAKADSNSMKINTKTSLDHLYIWGGSWFVYERMKREIPLSELISLNDAFIPLFEKISRQPESERTYQSDVSLNSPFVN